ncbi:YciI family protein [Sphingosinicella sp. CPCC 101087]|uniref:YciI family protein n=1 Tax=Sphingosinicella sp. CPCC 101087 TaxID=2497754 RepID=UPI00101C9B8F|nr:YciI family protein [Sphingosinicella sp. CPCC 101087]
MRRIPSSLFLLAACLFASSASAASEPAEVAPEATAATASELFVVIYRPGPAWQTGRPMNEQGLLPHGRYMRGLLDAGSLFAGGGFVGSDGGMAVLRAADLEAARAMVSVDPAVTSGIFVAEVEHWRPRFQSPEPLPRRASGS